MRTFTLTTRAATILVFTLIMLGFFQPALVGATSGKPIIAPAPSNHPHPHIMKVHNRSKPHTAPSNLLTYNGGPIMQTEVSYAIFWEPATLQDGSATHVSSTYNSLIQRYFNDIGGSGLYGTNTQYYDNNHRILNNSTFGGAWLDTSAYPPSTCTDTATPGNCLVDTDLQAEVQRAITINHWTGGLNSMFFVFTSLGEGSCFDTGSSSCSFTEYCGYHSFFNGSSHNPVIYANMPYTATSLNGCGVPTSPNNDIDVDSTLSVTSHEQMEAVTDPKLNAWYDNQGNEIGDKCAWNFSNINQDNNTANIQLNSNFYLVQQEWSNAIDGCTLTSQGTQSNGVLYVGSNDGYLYALNINDGSILWRAKTGVLSTPAIANGVVYIGSKDRYVYAFSSSDGTQRWRYKTNGAIFSSPTVANGVVYIGSTDGTLYTLDAAKGSLLGRFPIKSSITTTPTVVNNIVYIGATNGYFYAVNSQSMLWHYQVRGATFSSATVANGIVYFGSSNGYVYALDAAKGSLLWRYSANRAIVATPTITNSTVYVGTSNGNLYALNAVKGTLIWKFQTRGVIVSQATVSNGVIYFGSFDHYLYALDATRGSQMWKFQTGGNVSSSPAVTGGVVYIGSHDRNVYALKTTDSSQNWRYQTGGPVQSSPTVVMPS